MEDSVLVIKINGGDIKLQDIKENVTLIVSKNNRKFIESKPFKLSQREGQEMITM